MPYLVAGAVIVAVIGLINLALALALAHRLGVMTVAVDRLNERLATVLGPATAAMEPIGLPVADFSAVSVDGEPVGRDELSGWTLVAALSPDCTPCRGRLPEIVAACHQMPGGRNQVLAIVATNPTEPDGGALSAASMVADLRPVARVVVEPADGPAARALSIFGYPTFAFVSPDGVVAYRGHDVDHSVLPAVAS